jgi:dimethylglycine dehydrogenase
MIVEAGDADVLGDEPIWHKGKVVGWVTSGAYGHSVGKSLALGYVDRASAQATTGFAVELIGDRRPAVRLTAPAFDPTGSRMRA